MSQSSTRESAPPLIGPAACSRVRNGGPQIGRHPDECSLTQVECVVCGADTSAPAYT